MIVSAGDNGEKRSSTIFLEHTGLFRAQVKAEGKGRETKICSDLIWISGRAGFTVLPYQPELLYYRNHRPPEMMYRRQYHVDIPLPRRWEVLRISACLDDTNW